MIEENTMAKPNRESQSPTRKKKEQEENQE